MTKSKKKKQEVPEMELTFSNSQEEMNAIKDNEAFFRELGQLVFKFHKSIDAHGKKHGIQLDSSAVFKLGTKQTDIK